MADYGAVVHELRWEGRSESAQRERTEHLSASRPARVHDGGTRSSYWITSSARASTDGGIVSPSALAAFRLIANSNFVDCSIGSTAGFVPRRILSTKVAPRANTYSKSTPYAMRPPARTNSLASQVAGTRYLAATSVTERAFWNINGLPPTMTACACCAAICLNPFSNSIKSATSYHDGWMCRACVSVSNCRR